jgi:mitogen-activated protein kinase organizer 1
VTCGRDRSFALWNARRGACVKKYTGGHSREVRDASCARDGSKIATCGGDRGVFLWDVATGASVRRWSGHEGEGGVNAVELCGAGDSACASAGYDASVKMWDTRSKQRDADADDTCEDGCGVRGQRDEFECGCRRDTESRAVASTASRASSI